MDAHAERDMWVRGTVNIDGIRLRELPGITVSGTEHLEKQITLLDRLSAELHILCGDPAVALNWTFKAQEFFDSGVQQGRLLAQFAQQIGPLEHDQYTAADQV